MRALHKNSGCFEIRSYNTTKTKNTTSPNRKVQRPHEQKAQSYMSKACSSSTESYTVYLSLQNHSPFKILVTFHSAFSEQGTMWHNRLILQHECAPSNTVFTYSDVYIKKIIHSLICSCVTFIVIKRLQSILKQSHFG